MTFEYPPLVFAPDMSLYVPDEAACEAIWDKYDMLPNIRAHSRTVADTAVRLARRAVELGVAPAELTEETALAAGLLHDIAKTWSIRYGGSHDQLGAAIVRQETGNPLLAEAVLYHVRWPWNEGILAPESEPLRLSLVVAYADKRVRHDTLVTLDERFDDLMIRYGDTEEHRATICRNRELSHQQEAVMLRRLQLDHFE